jgi:hypothetical protein
MKKPYLSVVLIVGAQRRRAERALASLLAQEVLPEMEILLCDWKNNARPLLQAGHAAVRLFPVPAPATFTQARLQAVHLARGEAVAFLEEHAWVHQGWAAALMAAFRTGDWAAVGSEIHNGNPGRGISDGVALMNYLPWQPPAKSGPVFMLAGHNSAYRRSDLLSFDRDLGELLQSEVLLHWQLSKRKKRMYLEALAKISHVNEGSLAVIGRGYVLWNRCFGSSRARFYRYGIWQRLARTLAIPLVPFVRAARMAIYIWRHDRSRFRTYFHYFPVLILAWSAAAYGQSLGFFLGPGRAETDFTKYELTTPRPEA